MISRLLIAAILLYSVPAAAIDCHDAQGKGGRWSWRTVDGKRCWYQGAAGVDKAKLRWPSNNKSASLPVESKPLTVPLPTPRPDITPSTTKYYVEVPVRPADPEPVLNPPPPVCECPTGDVWPPPDPRPPWGWFTFFIGLGFAFGGLFVSTLWWFVQRSSRRTFRA